VSGFRPDIQIINHRMTVHRHIKDAQSLAIRFLTATRSVPRLYKIELHTVLTVGQGELIRQLVPSETEMLQQRPVTHSLNRIVCFPLTSQVRIQPLKIGSPATRYTVVIRHPQLTVFIFVFVATAIHTI